MTTYQIFHRDEMTVKDLTSEDRHNWRCTVNDDRALSNLFDKSKFELKVLFYSAKVYTKESEITSVMSVKLSNNDEIEFVLKSFRFFNERDGLGDKKSKLYLSINRERITPKDIVDMGFSLNNIITFSGVCDFYFNIWLPSKQYNKKL